jgi:hypothetical protein
MRLVVLTSLMLLSGGALAQDACTALARSAASPIAAPAPAPALVAPAPQLGAPSGVLAHAFSQAQTVDTVLLRLRIEKCRTMAMSTQPGTPGGLIDPATYKPKTEFDNTPWRFDMNQNGKRMTADEFDAWMKARGVRVARGGTAATPPATATEPAPQNAPAPQGD